MVKKTICFLIVLFSVVSGSYAQKILTLEKALEIAEENSPSVIASRLNLEGRQAALDANRAALKSKFALSVTPFQYSKTRSFNDDYSRWNTVTKVQTGGTFSIIQPVTETDGTLSLVNNFGWFNTRSEFFKDTTISSFSNNLYLQFTQPLFTYNKTKMTLRSMELDLENAQLKYAIDKLSIERSVTQYFYNVYNAQKGLTIVEEELANRKQSYEIIKNKVDAGISAKEELIQAELDLASSQANLYNQQASLENAKDQLKLTIGLYLDEDIAVLADISVDSVEIDMQKAVDYALANRQELRQREISIQNAYMDLTVQKATNEFKGDMTLSMGISGDDHDFPNIYDQPTVSPTVGIKFDIPIYDWGERKAKIKQAETGIESSELSLKNERNNITLNIRQIYRNLNNLRLQIGIQQKNIENAQLTYEINLERYRNGDLTSMDLNLVQNQLSQKKTDLTGAIINYKIELLNLKIESLWDFENNKPLIENNSSPIQ